MNKLTFINQTNSSYASRWRKELALDQVERGKELRKLFAINKKELNKPIPSTKSGLTATFPQEASNRKALEDSYKNKLRRETSQTRNTFKIDKNRNPTISDDRIYKIGDKQSISATGRQKLNNLKATRSGRLSKIRNKKLVIGALGLTTLGAGIAYGIRKIRSDKGKKRGKR